MYLGIKSGIKIALKRPPHDLQSIKRAAAAFGIGKGPAVGELKLSWRVTKTYNTSVNCFALSILKDSNHVLWTMT
jgi:hypothetical protein